MIIIICMRGLQRVGMCTLRVSGEHLHVQPMLTLLVAHLLGNSRDMERWQEQHGVWDGQEDVERHKGLQQRMCTFTHNT